MKIAWLLGWAVPEAWFAPLAQKAFSNAEHVFIAATSAALERLHAAAPFDQIVGYSLGAHLLLTSSAPFPHVALLAPFFAFSAEEKFGGRVARGQLRYLARWLRSDPAAALADFYFRSGLD
ncbi:MAG: hypothetical protein KGJ37_06675, partial [Verrucomicrobiota bacterium]|nr:hypothetical protein [Verrucomicrobiota bacterium]